MAPWNDRGGQEDIARRAWRRRRERQACRVVRVVRVRPPSDHRRVESDVPAQLERLLTLVICGKYAPRLVAYASACRAGIHAGIFGAGPTAEKTSDAATPL